MLCIGGTLGKGTLRMYPSLRVPTAKTALAPALVNVTDPHPEARRAGTVPPPPSRAPPLLVVGCRWGTAPVAAAGGCPGPKEEAPRTTTVAIAASPYLRCPCCRRCRRPHPCLRHHYRCSLCRRHCVSNAPVDSWLLCCLSPLAYCVVHRPNLSAPAIVRSSTLLLLGRRPLLLTIASHCPVALLPSINCFCRSL